MAIGAGGLAATGADVAGPRTVVVGPGDTLSAIAAREDVAVSSLVTANGLADPDMLTVGQRLVVADGHAGSSAHSVAPGETLQSIAARYGTSIAALAEANGITDPDRLAVGVDLEIPGGPVPLAPVNSGGGLPEELRDDAERLARRPVFAHWGGHYQLPVDLLEATCWMESGWQPTVVSSTGAVGIGQLMPAAVVHMREVIGDPSLDPYVADDNIRMSARLLRLLLDTHRGDVPRALAAYYQGPTSVRMIGPLPQTQAYVADVVALRPRFR